MRIEPSQVSTAGGGVPGSGLNATRDEFLRLFVAQLENQNPLDPQDGAAMVAQLAQFSSLEQQVEGNRRLDELVAAQDAAAGAGLADLAGRTVAIDVSTITVDGPVTMSGLEPVGASGLRAGELVVRGPAGEVIRRVPLTPGTPPTASWDGRDQAGTPVGPGAYSLAIEGKDADGAAVTTRPQLRGSVDAVELGGDAPRLRLGGLTVAPAAVRAILSARGGAA